MNVEERFETWREQRVQIETGEDFVGRVMDRVGKYERGKRRPLFNAQQLFGRISTHPWARAGSIVTGAVIGLVRLALVVRVVLG